MSFDEEWTELKGQTGQSSATRLDGTGSRGPGAEGKDGLNHVAADKKKAARYLEEHQGPDTVTAGNAADDDTEAITGSTENLAIVSPAGMRDWDVRVGLIYRKTGWDRHMKKLVSRLHSELSGLRQTNTAFHSTDLGTGASFQSVQPAFTNTPATDPLFGGQDFPDTQGPTRPSRIADF